MNVEEMRDNAYRKEQDRAIRAKELMDNDLLKEAFSEVERQIKEVWQGQQQYNQELSENAWRTLSCLEKVKSYLYGAIEDGEFATSELARSLNQGGNN